MVWVAMVFLFLIASAALALDTSGAFGAARTDQNTADLACLAGVRELPDQTAAINTAVAYIDANWPQMAGSTLSLSLPTATYDSAAGDNVFIDARYKGEDNTLYLRITERSPTTFGRAIGQDSITVVQEAACQQQEVQSGTGMLPIAALPGAWGGDLFDCSKGNKSTGNCGAIDSGSGGNAFRDSVAHGMVGNFIKHHGNQNAPDPDTGFALVTCAQNMNPCNAKDTETGNMTGPWVQGQEIRLRKIAGADCVEAGTFNCDSLTDVFGSIQPLSAIPDSDLGWWEPSLYGPLAAAKAATLPNARHWFYNGDQMKCDSPRLATIPIINWPRKKMALNWDIGEGRGRISTYGKKKVKFIGFYTVYIREPDALADISKEAMKADIVWFGPDAKCNTGEAFQPLGSSEPINAGIKLVAP